MSAVHLLGGRHQGEQVAGPEHHALAERGVRQAVQGLRERDGSGQAGRPLHPDERPRDPERWWSIPVVWRSWVAGVSQQAQGHRQSGWDSDFWHLPNWYRESVGREASTGDRSALPVTWRGELMSQVPDPPALLTCVPVLLGISLVLFTILALAPGDPFEELATNPNVPPEVRANLRAKFGLDDPIAVRYVRWFTSMLQGRLGLLLREPRRRGQADPPAAAHHPVRARLGPAAGAPGRAAGRDLRRPYAPTRIFDQIATTSPSSGFSLPTFFTGLLFILLFSIYLDWLPFIYRADIQATGLRWVLGEPQARASCPSRCWGSSRARR